MNDSSVVAGSLVLAVGFAGAVSVVTGSIAILGTTPLGISIYLAVGLGLPQYLLYRDGEDPVRLGLAVLSIAGAAVSLLAGFALGGLNDTRGFGIWSLLFIVVTGNLLGAVVRSFRSGYRSAV